MSAFRALVACDPSFAAQIEHDTIDHWLWGRFEMLSGDDKSTTYWLLACGHRMLYVPDAMVTTVEVVSGSAGYRTYANLKRWSGNSLRNSARIIALGPRRLGLFAWWCAVDQRLSNWTALVGPMVSLEACFAGYHEVAAGYLLWALVSRLGLAAIAWKHGRRFSAYYLPLQTLAEWANALIKLWVSSHPAKQSWMNRGNQSMDTTRGSAMNWARVAFANFFYGFSMLMFATLIGCYTGILPIHREAPLYLGVQLPAVGQVLLAPGELFRRACDNSILAPLAREAPLHSGVDSAVVGYPETYSDLLGYPPINLARTLPSQRSMNTTPRLLKRTYLDAAVPRVGFESLRPELMRPELRIPGSRWLEGEEE
jgi:hypothetical protein